MSNVSSNLLCGAHANRAANSGRKVQGHASLHEPYAHLYVGDYFTDTLDLSAHEHCALRLLLLETWVRGPIKCASGWPPTSTRVSF